MYIYSKYYNNIFAFLYNTKVNNSFHKSKFTDVKLYITQV
jgi:hypothetical protein